MPIEVGSSPAAVPVRSVDFFNRDLIDQHLDIALRRLTTRDRALFVNDVNERTLCARLGIYLQNEFRDFDVDCEYNRNHAEPEVPKHLHDEELIMLAEEARKRPKKHGTNFLFVLPDIIVHRRVTPENLLVIEVKKMTSTPLEDRFARRKLVVCRESKADLLRYRFAKFLRFRTGDENAETLIAENEFI